MNKLLQSVLACTSLALLAACATTRESKHAETTPTTAQNTPAAKPAASFGDPKMQLGAFSVSLAVKDIAASKAFYEKLGFQSVMGGEKQRFMIMRNSTTTIGLFQGMFDKNILTFNPGWDANCNTLPNFDDIRTLQRLAKERGLTLTTTADESTTGPASFTLTDPDGNMILLDQHVASPK
ncbi:MAG: VOC family protein [Phycisphaerales bacterium]